MVVVQYQFARDIISLTKPKITLMTAVLAAAGLMHAHMPISMHKTILTMCGIALLVSGSSALNMYFERELDKKMLRTKDRPLPAGRLQAYWGMITGWCCAFLALIFFYVTDNFVTLLLGVMAFYLYVFCYTPLKRKTWLSLIVGSIPGAMPVVLGYTAMTHSLDAKALALFCWAFLWQIPHFLAISLFREREYTEAGFPVLSKVRDVNLVKYVLLASSWILVLSTASLWAVGIIGPVNLVLCLFLGVVFLFTCHQGAFSRPTYAWSKRAFKASLSYQGLLFIALIVGAVT